MRRKFSGGLLIIEAKREFSDSKKNNDFVRNFGIIKNTAKLYVKINEEIVKLAVNAGIELGPRYINIEIETRILIYKRNFNLRMFGRRINSFSEWSPTAFIEL